MSDNLRRYLAIRDALRQWYPASLNGHQARHLITLAMLISGIVGSQHTPLDKVAAQVPNPAKPPGRSRRFARRVANDAITSAVYYVPGCSCPAWPIARWCLSSTAVPSDAAVSRSCSVCSTVVARSPSPGRMPPGRSTW